MVATDWSSNTPSSLTARSLMVSVSVSRSATQENTPLAHWSLSVLPQLDRLEPYKKEEEAKPPSISKSAVDEALAAKSVLALKVLVPLKVLLPYEVKAPLNVTAPDTEAVPSTSRLVETEAELENTQKPDIVWSAVLEAGPLVQSRDITASVAEPAEATTLQWDAWKVMDETGAILLPPSSLIWILAAPPPPNWSATQVKVPAFHSNLSAEPQLDRLEPYKKEEEAKPPSISKSAVDEALAAKSVLALKVLVPLKVLLPYEVKAPLNVTAPDTEAVPSTSRLVETEAELENTQKPDIVWSAVLEAGPLVQSSLTMTSSVLEAVRVK